MKQQYIAFLVVGLFILLAVGGGFAAGMKFQQVRGFRGFGNDEERMVFSGRGQGMMEGKNAQFRSGSGGGNRMGGFRPVTGEILKMDDTSITVKLPDGSSKIVLITSATAINKAADATKSDLTVGKTVAVFGTDNADGSVAATNIQLDPKMMGQALPSAQPASGK